MGCAIVLTALPVEYLAVRTHLTDLREETHSQGTVYERGQFTAGSQTWEVALVETGAGNSSAALEVERSIAYFNPDVILFVGIAGGIKDVALGDVVASTKVYGYEFGKTEAAFRARPEVGLSTYSLEQRARAEAKRSAWLRRLPSVPSPKPKVYVAPLAAGEKVVAAIESEIFKFLRSNYEDAIAVEMEGFGVLNAARANQRVSALVIRGISDLIYNKSQADIEGYQEIAARHASAFAFEILAKFKPDEKLVRAKAQFHEVGSTVYEAVSDFTGRQNVLKELINQVRGGRTIFNIWGMGGIGKTQLVRKLFENLKDDYPDGQIEINLKGDTPLPSSPSEIMGKVVRYFQPTFHPSEDPNELQSQYYSILKERTVLLFFDNASDKNQVELLIPPKNCLLIFTSRQHFVLPSLFAKNLDVLSRTEACELLLKIAPRIGDMADEIASICGYLPLAIRLAADALQQNLTLSAADYARLLRKVRISLQGINAVIKVQYELQTPELQKLWRMLAVFPESFDIEGVAKAWELDLEFVDDFLSRLVSVSLVQWQESKHRCRLHDLLRSFAYSELSTEEIDLISARHSAHYQKVLAGAFLKEKNLEARLRQIDTEWANIQTGFEWIKNQLGKDLTAAKICRDYVAQAYEVLNTQLHPREKLRWTEYAIRAAQELEDPQSEALLLGVKGWALQDLGEIQSAIKCQESQLRIARRSNDLDNKCIALSSLGANYRMVGQPKKAIKYLEQCIRVSSKTGNRWRESFSYGQMGLAYADLGDIIKAVGCYKKQLSIAELDEDHYNQSSALGSLGFANLYLNPPQVEQSISYFTNWLSSVKRSRDRVSEGNALGGLGLAYFISTNYSLAIEYCKQHIELARETGDRRGEGASLGNMAKAYAALDEFTKAIELYQEHIDIARSMPDRRGESDSSWHLGLVYERLGMFNEASEAMKVTLNYEKSISHPDYEEHLAYVEAILEGRNTN